MDPHKLSHRTDPAVSVVAAITVASGTHSEQVMHAVIELLTDRGPSTPDELSDAYYRTRELRPDLGWPLVKLHTVNKRVSEMKKHIGVLRGVGRRDGAQLLDLVDDRQQAHEDVTGYWRKDAA
jgi:hypothetical protein